LSDQVSRLGSENARDRIGVAFGNQGDGSGLPPSFEAPAMYCVVHNARPALGRRALLSLRMS